MPIRPTNPQPGRIPSLDGLRAVSILAVMFSHLAHTANFPDGWMNHLALRLDGRLGVRVFFVISGFLITTLLLKETAKNGRVSLSAFYKRRALRILPVYYLYVFILAVIAFLGLRAIPVSTFLSAGTFTTKLWGQWATPSTWPLEHTWSLAIEEQFYFTWPLLLACLKPKYAGRIWIPFLLILAPVLRFLLWRHPLIDFVFPTQGDSLASGCFLALLMERRPVRLSRAFQFQPALGRVAAVAVIFSNLIVGMVLRRLHVAFFPERFFVAFLPGFQCAAICYLIGSLVMNRSGASYWLLNLGFVQWLGRLSYSLYIWQQLVLVPAGFPVFPANWKTAAWLIQFPQNLIAAFILATLSYYCLEQPMLRLKTRFAKIPASS